MTKNKILCTLILLLTVYFLFAGYAAFEDSMSISNVASIVRLQENIRVSSFAYSSATSSATSAYEEHGLKSLVADVNLPNTDSTVTYEVIVTNYGNTEMGIYEFTGLPSNLTYSVTDYNLHDKICNSSGECTLGASKTFYLTVSYTSDGYDSSNTEYSLNIGVDFRGFYTVTYENITNNGYPSEVISGGNLVVNFGSALSKTPTVYVNGQALSNSLYSYESGTLTYNNVTGNVVIKPASLSSIAVTTLPRKVMYNIGDQFNPAGMVVTATYSDGSTAEITNYTYTPTSWLTENDTTITISYTENGQIRTTTQEIQVGYIIYLTGDGIVTDAANGVSENVAYVEVDGIQYASGTKEIFVEPGKIITLYSSDAYIEINGDYYSASTKTMTVTSPISVCFIKDTSNMDFIKGEVFVITAQGFITTPPYNVKQQANSSFDPTGMVITHINEDGSKEIVTDYTHSESGWAVNNDTVVTISYTRNGKTYTQDLLGIEIRNCFTEGTLITLADGTQKPIEDITYEDELLVWDFYNGKYTSVTPSLIESGESSVYRVLNLKFSDGTTVRIIDNHGFFDVQENNFVFISEQNVGLYVGREFIKTTEVLENKRVKLVDYEVTLENIRYYTLLTSTHSNCIAEGMLTLTPPPIGLTGWYDTFEIGEGMKYDEGNMKEMIDKYGLYEYDAFSDYITYEQFIAYNGPYLKIVVGKGYFTYEDIIDAIEYFYEIIISQQ